MGFIPRLGRSPRGERGNAFQYSCLASPTGRRAWWASIQGPEELAARDLGGVPSPSHWTRPSGHHASPRVRPPAFPCRTRPSLAPPSPSVPRPSSLGHLYFRASWSSDGCWSLRAKQQWRLTRAGAGVWPPGSTSGCDFGGLHVWSLSVNLKWLCDKARRPPLFHFVSTNHSRQCSLDLVHKMKSSRGEASPSSLPSKSVPVGTAAKS